MSAPAIRGFERPDGRLGIRNLVVVAYLVECAHHVARRIVEGAADPSVELVGFPGCYPNDYAARMMAALATHPNVAGAVLISLGCESFDRERLAAAIAASGRPVETVVIQQAGGTRAAIAEGIAAARRLVETAARTPRRDMGWDELVIGTICGGSDGLSGVTANPAVGGAFDRMLDLGATCMFEETGEMIGCEGPMAQRAMTPAVADALVAAVDKAERYYRIMGFGSFAPGNAEGGLTTQEEKSAGAYVKSGTRPIRGVIKPPERPGAPGLYLMDVVPDGEPRFGFPNISDNAEITEMIASGCHLILFTTGRGSVVGSAIAPVIKICSNPTTYRRLADDMDIDAGRIVEGRGTLDEVSEEIVRSVAAVAAGTETRSEQLGHREFLLTYKTFEPAGPSCLAHG